MRKDGRVGPPLAPQALLVPHAALNRGATLFLPPGYPQCFKCVDGKCVWDDYK